MSEVVLTTRRARVLVEPRRWVPGRLRLSDRLLLFVSADGELRVALPLRTVTAVRVSRAAVTFESTDATLRLRCFGVAGVAALVESARR